MQLGISEAEFQSRRQRLLDVVSSRNETGVVLFDHDYVVYFTGFFYLSTERPVAFVMNVARRHGAVRASVRGRSRQDEDAL